MVPHPINIDSIQTDLEKLSVAPQILPKLQALVSDCNTNPDDIRDMIRMDPALSSMILRTANSAYFNPGYHIDSIDDAIMQLGFSDVYQIVAMLAFSELMAEPLPAYGLNAGQFWRRSVACALAMERLARKYSEDPGVAYTIGLLHGLGMAFLDKEIRKLPGVELKSALPEDVAVSMEETKIFGINHAAISGLVMKKWGFSDEIVIPISCQFEPSEAGRHERMTCLISFAKRMIGTIINDQSGNVALPGPDPLLIALLHLTKDEYQRVVEQLRVSFEKAQGLVSDMPSASGRPAAAGRMAGKKSMETNLGYGGRRIRM